MYRGPTIFVNANFVHKKISSKNRTCVKRQKMSQKIVGTLSMPIRQHTKNHRALPSKRHKENRWKLLKIDPRFGTKFRFRKNLVEGNKVGASPRRQKRQWENERVRASRLKGSHPLCPTLSLPPCLSINHNYILSLPCYRS